MGNNGIIGHNGNQAGCGWTIRSDWSGLGIWRDGLGDSVEFAAGLRVSGIIGTLALAWQVTAYGKPGFVVNIHSFSFGHSVPLSATHHHGESSLHVLVGLPSQVVSWFESIGWPFWWFLVLYVLVCAGPVVSFERVLICHTLPMLPTVHCGCSCLR